MKRKLLVGILAFASSAAAFAQSTDAATAVAATGQTMKYLAAAIAVGTAAIGGSFAVAKIGAAAVGAMAESPSCRARHFPMSALRKVFACGVFWSPCSSFSFERLVPAGNSRLCSEGLLWRRFLRWLKKKFSLDSE